MNYRPDIDGLRAIAVLAVLFFHANETWAPGGFVGVDIFFVISGFLISKHIFASLQKGNFSFKDFYCRRVNRIMPALYGLIVFSLLLVGIFYLPGDFEKFSQSGIEALTYKANYYFASDYDYFSSGTGQLPLLHLWSLSVEEQFYFILPLFLYSTSRFLKPRNVLILVGSALLISLLWCELQIYQGQLKSAFYSIPTRACELLLGTCLAKSSFPRASIKMREFAAALGMALIILAVFLISGATKFPGIAAFIPCLGAALIIGSGDQRQTRVAQFLSTKPLVFVGLISYSLYLYHWPLMAVFRYVFNNNQLSVNASLFLIFWSFVFAILSWHFIEKPFRYLKLSFKSNMMRALVLPSILLLAVLLGITAVTGLPQRYLGRAKEVVQNLLYLSDHFCHNRFSAESCIFGDKQKAPQILLIGDSHAGHYQPALDEMGKIQNFSFLARSTDSCRPFIKIPDQEIQFSLGNDCRTQTLWSEQQIEKFDIFILAGNWHGYHVISDFEIYTQQLTESVQYLRSKNKTVIFAEQIPDCVGYLEYLRQYYSPLSFLFDLKTRKQQIQNTCGENTRAANSIIKKLAKEKSAQFLDLISKFEKEQGPLPFSADRMMYKEDSHLNQAGSQFLGQWLGKNLQINRE